MTEWRLSPWKLLQQRGVVEGELWKPPESIHEWGGGGEGAGGVAIVSNGL